MSTQLYNIVTNVSDISYSNVAIIAPVNGVNYINSSWKHMDTYTYTGSTDTGSYYIDIINNSDNVHSSSYILYHITGTITRDITDNAMFYYFGNKRPIVDQITLIPVEPYQSEINIDIVNITTYQTTSYQYYRLWLYTCNKDFNTLTAHNDINITVDYYCL